jgi:hypothetical protein
VQGCVGAVHVGQRLLPFFTEEQLFVGAAAALLASQPHYALMYDTTPHHTHYTTIYLDQFLYEHYIL